MSPSVAHIIDVSEESDLWKQANLSNEYIHDVILNVLNFIGLSQAFEVSLVLANNNFIKKINNEWRHMDKATNVLSFPQYETFEEISSLKSQQPLPIGDVIISFEKVEEEAKDANISFNDHFTHMLIHGILHLFGYDHIKEKEANEMEAIEINLLKDYNIQSPYENNNE